MQTNNLYDSPYFLWPYMPVYPGKTNDFSLHPAFMATQLPVYHNFCRNSTAGDTPSTGPFANDVHDNNDHSPHHHQQQQHRRFPLHHSTPRTHHHLSHSKSKRSSFTIDAILHGEEERKEEVTEQLSPSQLSSPSPIHHMQQATPDSYLSVRRHQRLLEPVHPYYESGKPVTPIASAAAVKCAQKGSSADKKNGGKGKRVRTIFTPEQLERLEAEFERQQYMVGTERYYLAASLSLTEAQVKVWFQNRRIKWRKQTLEQQHARLASLYANNSASDSDDDSGEERDDGGAAEKMRTAALCSVAAAAGVTAVTTMTTTAEGADEGGEGGAGVADGQ